jgi:hypothetical protein
MAPSEHDLLFQFCGMWPLIQERFLKQSCLIK